MSAELFVSQELQQTLAELSTRSAQAENAADDLRKALRALELYQIELKRQNQELQVTQKELEVSRTRYADLFDNAPVGYLVFNEQGTIITANITIERMLGYDRHELAGRPLSALLAGDTAWAGHFKKCLTGEANVISEISLLTRSGTPIPVQLVCEVALDPTDRLAAREYRATITDLTELKQSQRETESIRLQLAHAIQSTNLRVWSRDLRSDIVAMTSSGPSSTGSGLTEWRGPMGKAFQSIHPEDGERVNRVVAEAVAQKKDFHVEMRVHAPDGTYEWCETRGHVRTDASGQPAFLEGITISIEERKKAEEQIRDVARFPDENPSPILRCKNDGTLLYANRASAPLCRVTGAEPGRIAPEPFLGGVTLALSTRHGRVMEITIGRHVFSFLVVPIHGRGYVNLYGRDITDQRKAEDRVQRQADLIDLSPDAMFVRSLDGVVTFWSSGAERLYGYTKEEAEGRLSNDLLATQFPEPFEDIVAALRRTGRWEGELGHTKRNGGVVRVQSRWLFRRGEHGHPDEVFESNVDITDRILMEDELRQSEERFRTLIETSGLPVAVLDQEFRFRALSPPCLKLLRWSGSTLPGRHATDLIPEHERVLFEKAAARLVQGNGGKPAILMTEFAAEDTTRRWVEWELAPIRAAGVVKGFVANLRELQPYVPHRAPGQ